MVATAQAREIHLQWTPWFVCDSRFNVSLLPTQAGLFAVAEEVILAAHTGAAQRTLNVMTIEAADDLFHGLNQAFTAGLRVRGRMYLRYAIVDDRDERYAAAASLKSWLEGPNGSDDPFVRDFAREVVPSGLRFAD